RWRRADGDVVVDREVARHIAATAIDDAVALVDRDDELARCGDGGGAPGGRKHACGRKARGGGDRRAGDALGGDGVLDRDGAGHLEPGTGGKGRGVALGDCGRGGGRSSYQELGSEPSGN